MHFGKGELPPVRGFWSLTMYDANYFFVSNPINRYSISARQSLKTNSDGSTDPYIQKDSPGPDLESNWLPACWRRRESAEKWRRKPSPRPAVGLGGRGWSGARRPVKAGLRPPPSATVGLDRASRPAVVRHQGFDGDARLKLTQEPCQLFSLRHLSADSDSHPHGSVRKVHPDVASVLAQREQSLDPRRFMDHPTREAASVKLINGQSRVAWRSAKQATRQEQSNDQA
jgi:Protein of unknown function (DUF1214)